MNLERHKNSEFATYLLQHTKPAINTVARPFETDEAGRLKSTEVLDHIIKLRKDRASKKVALISKLKEEEQEAFVQGLLAKKQAQKEAKR